MSTLMSYSETKVPNDGAHHGHPTLATDKMPQRTWAESSEKATKEIVFGSVAGMCSKVFEYPFDTVKVRLQAQRDGIPRQYKGPLDCFQQSIRRDGFLSLYRGLTAPMIGAAVENSSLFFSYDLAQTFFASHIYNTTTDELTLSTKAICGAISGAFTSLLLTPIELVKCRMQMPLDKGSGVTRLPGVLATMSAVYRSQGVRGFWNGQLGTLLRETGGSAAWFGSQEGVSMWFRKRNGMTDPRASLPVHQQLMAGAAAGMSYNFIFYPADTIKSCMQTGDLGALAPAQRQTFTSVGRALWKAEGLQGLYRGCGLTVMRSAPGSAIIFYIHDALTRRFPSKADLIEH